jgi:dienelactone hydrolase
LISLGTPINMAAMIANRALLGVLSLAAAILAPGGATAADELVTARLEGRTISGLVTRDGAGGFKRGIALFPGHPGILRLRAEDGELRYELRGNFLVRSRRHWLDAETLTLVLDAPDDQWASFAQHFRASARYGEDVRALLDAVDARYGRLEWTFVGTSEGSVSAFHAARMLPERAARVALTASVFLQGRNGPGLSDADWSKLKVPLLWVHHVDDPCPYTAYRDAVRFAAASAAPLVTVRGGGPARGPACMARTQHGFVGIEASVVRAMRDWALTGRAPESVAD